MHRQSSSGTAHVQALEESSIKSVQSLKRLQDLEIGSPTTVPRGYQTFNNNEHQSASRQTRIEEHPIDPSTPMFSSAKHGLYQSMQVRPSSRKKEEAEREVMRLNTSSSNQSVIHNNAEELLNLVINRPKAIDEIIQRTKKRHIPPPPKLELPKQAPPRI